MAAVVTMSGDQAGAVQTVLPSSVDAPRNKTVLFKEETILQLRSSNVKDNAAKPPASKIKKLRKRFSATKDKVENLPLENDSSISLQSAPEIGASPPRGRSKKSERPYSMSVEDITSKTSPTTQRPSTKFRGSTWFSRPQKSRSPHPIGDATTSVETVDSENIPRSSPSRRRSFLPRSRSNTGSSGSSPERKRASSLRRLARPLSFMSNPAENDASETKGKPDFTPTCLRLDSMTPVEAGRPVEILDSEILTTSSFLPEKKSIRHVEPRGKDAQAATLQSLETDLEKFRTKARSAKMVIIRGSLLPFLQSKETKQATRALQTEDLSRRVALLDSWWTTLLDMLSLDANQVLSALDKPAVMDAISLLMERNEWTLGHTVFNDGESLSAGSLTSGTDSLDSLPSSESGRLTSSIHVTARDHFVKNLLRQMAYVVESMSLSRWTATAVRLCGKTCAYSFIHCPGIGDVLVRLWSPTIGSLQRTLNASGLKRATKLDPSKLSILTAFPPHLRSLELKGLIQLYKNLKISVPPPPGTRQVDWCGQWVRKFSGQESDLFIEFCKHYFTLVADLLPREPTAEESIAVPGMIFVQSQILVNLDATVAKRANLLGMQQSEQANGGPDESDVDPAALTLASVTNAGRIMADNRLVQLLRDMLFDGKLEASGAARMFVPIFSKLLEATAKNIPVVNHSAMFTLLELLEETLPLIYQPELTQGAPVIIDWSFWIEVWSRMTSGFNTSVEVKIYQLVYTLWPAFIDHPAHRHQMFDFLLQPRFFLSRFSHSCPLIRAYFMRLICWRVVLDGASLALEVDGQTQMMGVSKDRQQAVKNILGSLHTTYAIYLHMQQEAQKLGNAAPSIIACNPIPGRRLVIVMNDQHRTGGAPVLTASNASFSGGEALTSGFTMTTIQPTLTSKDKSRPKRFSFLRPGSSSSKEKRSDNDTVSAPSTPDSSPNTTPPMGSSPFTPRYTPKFFRFSLDIDKRPPGQANAHTSIQAPKLPAAAQDTCGSKPMLKQSNPSKTTDLGSFEFESSQSAIGHDAETAMEIQPRVPDVKQCETAKYAGQALAEWANIVSECDNFFARRKADGVPSDALVEIPSLRMELAKKPTFV